MAVDVSDDVWVWTIGQLVPTSRLICHDPNFLYSCTYSLQLFQNYVLLELFTNILKCKSFAINRLVSKFLHLQLNTYLNHVITSAAAHFPYQ